MVVASHEGRAGGLLERRQLRAGWHRWTDPSFQYSADPSAYPSPLDHATSPWDDLAFAVVVREAHAEMQIRGYRPEQAKAVATLLACVVDKQADFNSSLC